LHSNIIGIAKESGSEREPCRVLEIQEAKSYSGELGQQGSNLQKNTKKVWIVNGHVEKADGNFHRHFNVSEIKFNNINRSEQQVQGDGKLFIGPCPQSFKDFEKLRDLDVMAVVSL